MDSSLQKYTSDSLRSSRLNKIAENRPQKKLGGRRRLLEKIHKITSLPSHTSVTPRGKIIKRWREEKLNFCSIELETTSK